MKILANDGIDAKGQAALEAMGCTVLAEKVSQDALAGFIHNENIDGLLVRSATTARKELIDACPNLKFIGRGGVGIDNIDAVYAREKGVDVFNTPASSSASVAELVMAMMFASNRFLYQAGGAMPVNGEETFEVLKKNYGKGKEVKGKTLGIIGFGRIGQSLAEYALGCGMRVMFFDRSKTEQTVTLSINGSPLEVKLDVSSFEEVLRGSDFISLHVPKQPNGSSVIGAAEFALMKKNAVVINTSRGGTIHEGELIEALDNGVIAGACLDVFENEPRPNAALLKHVKIIATPHIGAATAEAQERIGLEIADNVKRIMQGA
jgi:D-3-phosphoglycerate dehydrogenase